MKTKKQLNMELASNIKRLREKMGVSQEELADKAGFYRTYIGHLENAKYTPSAYTLYKLSIGLRVDICEILKVK